MSKLKFFSACNTLRELKSRYRELVYLYHPDRNGNATLEIMKQVNNEYEQAFDYILKHPFNEQEKKSNFYANVNDGFREQVAKVSFIPGIQIEICGSWIWLSGNTKPVKDTIKNAGFAWAPKKYNWYWHPAEYHSRKHKTWDMNKIRDTYGSQSVETKEREKITI